MQYLWIGNLEEDQEFLRKTKHGYSNNSAQITQKKIIFGLEKNLDVFIDSINGSAVGKYPQYKEKKISPIIWSHDTQKRSFDISVGFWNVSYCNRFFCQRSMEKAAKKWIEKRYLDEGLVIFVYSLRLAPLSTAILIKKRIPKAQIVNIITDLPQYMDLSESPLKKALKSINTIALKQKIKKVDKFVLFASKMADYLKINPGKWVLMEGCWSGGTYPQKITNDSKFSEFDNTFNFVYNGKLEEKYGIAMLLDAFSQIKDSNIRLLLSGEGSYSKRIIEASEQDPRIQFFGFLSSYEDVIKLQSKASCLMNMRLPSEQNSAYSFPSKLFEYMITGKPIISFKIGGIPTEYYSFLKMVNEETSIALSSTMKEVIELNEADLNKVEEEVDFIMNKKNSIEQTKKIVTFLKKS